LASTLVDEEEPDQEGGVAQCMNKDVSEWVNHCQSCARAKVTSQQDSSGSHISTWTSWFLGSLPVSEEGF